MISRGALVDIDAAYAVTRKSVVALACERSLRVAAVGVRRAVVGVGSTFVDVKTAGAIARVAIETCARKPSGCVAAHRIGSTVVSFSDTFVDIGAGVAVTGIAIRTQACESTLKIVANSICATIVCVSCAFVDILAGSVYFYEPWRAMTANEATTGIGALGTGGAVASSDLAFVDIDTVKTLSRRIGITLRAGVTGITASRVRTGNQGVTLVGTVVALIDIVFA